jgi:hypothetical protein
MASHNGCDRLDRIERALELLIDDHVQFREEHKKLLAAQVVLTDRVEKLAVRVDKLTERIEQIAEMGARTDQRIEGLAEAGAQTDGRLNALIKIVDGIIRRQQ